MMSTSLHDIAILNINCADYHCIINGISKNETINLLKNVNLIEKVNLIEWNIIKLSFFSFCLKDG